MEKMSYNPSELIKSKDYLICIDSDGCVFDSMEVKHKECFIPNIIGYWGLEAISKYARMAAEFVNLYSKDRGCNRFPALVKTFDLLDDWEEVQRRGFKTPDITSLRKWVEEEPKLGNPALIKYVEENPDDAIMQKTLKWSVAVNDTIEKIVRFVPPFPLVVESLEKLFEKADIIIVSGTPTEALAREWALHNISKFVKVIAGQEAGSKKDCIATAMAKGYDKDKVIMIGDAPGDHKAALANDIKFYPINPGLEEKSWQVFFNEAISLFFDGAFSDDYQTKLLDDFNKVLPSTPPWK